MTNIQVYYTSHKNVYITINSPLLKVLLWATPIINDHLLKFEQSLEKEDTQEPLANSMLVLMVRGLFSRLQFPYAQFPCTSISGDQFYDIIWEAVCHLERCGFKVLACTCDGLSSNRRFMKLHHMKGYVSHKVLNPYSADGRFLFFISDPPHLIKTVRNCWANQYVGKSSLLVLVHKR